MGVSEHKPTAYFGGAVPHAPLQVHATSQPPAILCPPLHRHGGGPSSSSGPRPQAPISPHAHAGPAESPSQSPHRILGRSERSPPRNTQQRRRELPFSPRTKSPLIQGGADHENGDSPRTPSPSNGAPPVAVPDQTEPNASPAPKAIGPADWIVAGAAEDRRPGARGLERKKQTRPGRAAHRGPFHGGCLWAPPLTFVSNGARGRDVNLAAVGGRTLGPSRPTPLRRQTKPIVGSAVVLGGPPPDLELSLSRRLS